MAANPYSVVPENIHTGSFPMEGIFTKTLLPLLWKFQLSFVHFSNYFGLLELPHPTRKFQSLLWG